jgi:hypothetical protein
MFIITGEEAEWRDSSLLEFDTGAITEANNQIISNLENRENQKIILIYVKRQW